MADETKAADSVEPGASRPHPPLAVCTHGSVALPQYSMVSFCRGGACLEHGIVQSLCGKACRVRVLWARCAGVWLIASPLVCRTDLLLEGGYDALYKWSVDNVSDFWGAAWDFLGMCSSTPYTSVVSDPKALPGAQWFEGARLNFAQNLLRFRDDRTALIFRSDCSTKDVKITYRFVDLWWWGCSRAGEA